ncbi:MAG: TetR/AcrR family transcriptional regulator [Pseudomonadota bacterium]
MNAARPRTRLSPEARRTQLLDTAKTMVIAEGLQAFTMEGLAREAGVSAPLVYNYFSGRPELLKALLAREYERFVQATVEAVRSAKNFEDIVRLYVTSNFDHHAPGNILPLLLSQPELASAIRTEQQRRGRQNAKFLVSAAADTYQLNQRQAQLVVSMSSGASIAAAELAANAKLKREETIDLAVSYIMAGIERIASE